MYKIGVIQKYWTIYIKPVISSGFQFLITVK